MGLLVILREDEVHQFGLPLLKYLLKGEKIRSLDYVK